MTLKRVFLFSLILAIMISTSVEAKTVRVCVFPFSIYSQENLGYLSEGIQEMIGSHFLRRGVDVIPESQVIKALKGKSPTQIDERAAREIGKALNADYVFYGSMTKLGNQISLDGRLVDVLGIKKTESVFVQEKGLENLMGATEKLVSDATGGVSGRQKIARLNIQGNKRIETDAVKRVLESREGGVYSDALVSGDLKRVFAMNYFEDVQIDVEDSAQGKVVTFIVVEKPAITQVEFEGNQMLEQDDLFDVLGYNTYGILDAQKIAQSVENIKELYKEKGYYNVEVNYTIEPVGEKKVSVKYEIEEKSRVYIKKIEFLGNKDFDDGDLEDEIETETGWFLSFITDAGILKKDQLEEDLAKLKEFYYNNGYVRSRIGEPVVTVEEDGIIISFSIEEGPQFKVGDVKVAGDILFTDEEIYENLKLPENEIYSRKILREDLKTIKTMYADKGYAYNQVKPEAKARPDEDVIDVVFHIAKNKPVTFERISITGNSKTRDNVIRRELKIKEGDLFSASGLRQSSMSLYRLGYFDDIQFDTAKASADDKMNLNINVKEKPTGAFSIGAGYSSYNSLFGTAKISQDNFLGKGLKVSLEGTVGGRSDNYVFSITEPWLFGIPLAAGFDIFNQFVEYDDYDRNTVGFALRFGYPVWKNTRFSWRYMYQDIDISNVPAGSSAYFIDMVGHSTSSSMTFQLRRDTRNQVFNPTSGSDNSVTITYAGGPLGGTNHFTKYVADSGWFIPTFWDDVTFFARGKIGYIAENQDDGLPLYEKFYLGGIDSVRGYKWNKISPTDPVTGDRIGGEKMALINLELIFPLAKEAGLMGVIFFDQGNAWRESDDWDFGDMKRSYGGGIRYYSPLGPMRLEYGMVLDPIPGEPESNLEFSIGTFF